jgi:hypothetical protein
MNTICRSPTNIFRRWCRSSAGAASRPTSRTPGSDSGGAASASIKRQRHVEHDAMEDRQDHGIPDSRRRRRGKPSGPDLPHRTSHFCYKWLVYPGVG